MSEQDKKSRSAHKGVISKYIITLERLLAEEDADTITSHLQKMKEAFNNFDEAHDKYHNALAEDAEDEIAASDKYFLEVNQHYIEAVRTGRGWLKTASTSTSIKTHPEDVVRSPQPTATQEFPKKEMVSSADLMSVLNLPKAEIVKFKGDPLQYHCFVALFDECVKSINDDSVKLTRLLQYTTGKARDAIETCILLKDGYDKARAILKQRFGDDHLITDRVIRSIRRGKAARTAEEIQDLADEVNNGFRTLSQIDRIQEIDNQHCIVEVMSRLQPFIQHRWTRKVMDVKRSSGKYPSFENFADFLSNEAQEANDPMYGRGARSSDTKAQHKSSNATSVFSSGITNTNLAVKRECVVCKGDHKLLYCKDFKSMTAVERRSVVHKFKLCENCLLSNHKTVDCRKNTTCSVPGCGERHTKFIHVNQDRSSTGSIGAGGGYRRPPNDNAAVRMVNANVSTSVDVHMPVVAVNVNGKKEVCSLLDSGSSNSFCTQSLVDSLRLTGTDVSYTINTLTGEENRTSVAVNLCIASLDGRESLQMSNVYVVDSIPVVTSELNVDKLSHIKGISLVAEGQRVELLIGQDNSEALLPLEIRKGKRNEPFACRTLFGWTLNGPEAKGGLVGKNVMSNFISASPLESKIDQLWEIEKGDFSDDTLGYSLDDRKVLELWDKEVKLVDGHYELPIPWKEGVVIPNNYVVAESRLKSLLKSLQKRDLFDRYKDEMGKLVAAGYAEPVPVNELHKKDRVWFLPHQAVVSDKKPDKVRIVFDCASKFRGESLNDKCLQGPDVNNKLLHVLLRFRQHEYALMADIEAMYYQVLIPSEDRNVLRFLWLDDNDEVVQFRMTRHVFGGIWCSSSSTYALRQVLVDNDVDSVVANTVLKGFYVDDCLKSVESVEDAMNVIRGTRQVLGSGGFNLTKFVTNDASILNQIPNELLAKEVKDLNPESHSKVLGLRWDIQNDYLYFDVKVNPELMKSVTKRSILSILASMYDPLGLMGPFLVAGKILFQKVTSLKWDDVVSADLAEQWLRWIDGLQFLSILRIPRCVKPGQYNDAMLELHCFSDASMSAYGCCCYLRCVSWNGLIHTALLLAKTRVAPAKTMTIPRLELQAAVLSAQIAQVVSREMDLKLTEIHFWTDSEVVLKYISNDSRRFQVFVANRVSTIRNLSDPKQWHHIVGTNNPADLVTRPQIAESLNVKLWLEGPEFLRYHKSEWEVSKCDSEITDDLPEVKKVLTSMVASAPQSVVHPMEKLIDYYSDWSRLVRAVAWIQKVKSRLKGDQRLVGSGLSVIDVKDAEVTILRYVQGQSFGDELSRLRKDQNVGVGSSVKDLCPFLDQNGVIRVGGRLKNARVPSERKQPILLPHSHRVASLIALSFHNEAHLGTEWVVSKIRSKYWITRIRSVVKKVSSNCVICKKLFASRCTQRMADLPEERLEPGKPPFSYVGIDCFGPFMVKRGRSSIKRYGCVFTCFTTRAIHIEKLDSLETDSFLNGFRRFASRRGAPLCIWSDRGTNFIGAKSEIDKNVNAIVSDPSLQKHFVSKGIEWRFTPPGASHMGGVWERMIRTIRKVLNGMSQSLDGLTDDAIHTLFCEVETIVNGRPLTKASDSIDDPAPLTPNHLLLLREIPSLPPGIFSEADMFKKQWKCVQHLAKVFWQRWLKEYVPELQRRGKWVHEKPNVRVGDLVLIANENTPRGVWPMGLVVDVHKSQDDLVRSVKVKTKSTYLERPISKIVLLEGVHK